MLDFSLVYSPTGQIDPQGCHEDDASSVTIIQIYVMLPQLLLNQGDTESPLFDISEKKKDHSQSELDSSLSKPA